jgi:hypothetical protein
VSNAIGGAEIEIGTTLGSRIPCRTNAEKHHQRTKMLAPDALVNVMIWRRGWLDGETTEHDLPVVRRGLLIELDRGTIGIKEIGRRIRKYGETVRPLGEKQPALVWVIDGSSYRERTIIEVMRESNIEGWTITVERLVIPECDPWWIIYSPVKLSDSDVRMGLSSEAIGGMAPWREVWNFTMNEGMQPFLGIKTWEGRELGKGRSEGNNREWMRYTHDQMVTTTEGI